MLEVKENKKEPLLRYVGYHFLLANPDRVRIGTIHSMNLWGGVNVLAMGHKNLYLTYGRIEPESVCIRFHKETGILSPILYDEIRNKVGMELIETVDGDIIHSTEIDDGDESYVIRRSYINESFLLHFLRKSLSLIKKVRETISSFPDISQDYKDKAAATFLLSYVNEVLYELITYRYRTYRFIRSKESTSVQLVGLAILEILDCLHYELSQFQLPAGFITGKLCMSKGLERAIRNPCLYLLKKAGLEQDASVIFVKLFDMGFSALTDGDNDDNDDDDNVCDLLRKGGEFCLRKKSRRHHLIYF